MRTWEDDYRDGTLPWDAGVADPALVEAVSAGRMPMGAWLEIGCGLGTDAAWLSARGNRVIGVDLAPTAIATARARHPGVRFEVHDVIAEPLPGGPVDAVFDRGCFHVFDEDDRATFARRVADVLRPGGMWMSLIGSTEGPPRDTGPPRRSALDVVRAVEPHLEIVALEDSTFATHERAPRAWILRARRRGSR